MNIVVIPARGGSKRIPRKNIRPFAGKPMIVHAIDVARASGMFESIVVSTDDEEISRIARDAGAVTPFVRPAALADDQTATVPVVAHAVAECRMLGWQLDQVCCLYPAVPFLRVGDLHAGLALLEQSTAAYCLAVSSYPAAIQRALTRQADGRLAPFFPQFELVRTQDLEPAFHDAGQFYWASADTWTRETRIHAGGIGHVIERGRVVDIDTPEDWEWAEQLYEFRSWSAR